MKLNLFLFASIFAALHLSKAGPLRLHKRAAFYIANETACVVDNIVYSNGEPIPTDDPCEACKCRPPGFACMLQECRVKPGCRAVRHAGQCCPEYVCGCEHNGRMYQDGEEIPHDKNPCYTCYCQGSSIACAFIDCLFRVDCTPETVPGECCPKYTNCTRDLPGNNVLNENSNPPPSLNLLPALNDELVIPSNLPTQKPASSEIPTDPPAESPVIVDRSGEAPIPEPKEPIDAANKEQTTEATISDESKLNPEVDEKGTGEESSIGESNRNESPKDETENKNAEDGAILLNSETEIKREDNSDTTEKKSEEPTETIKVVEDPQTTSENSSVSEAEDKVKLSESEPVSSETSSTEKQVKNSAADNSKSLKLADNENNTVEPTQKSVSPEISTNESEKKEEIKPEELNKSEAVTQSSTESSVKTESVEVTKSAEKLEDKVEVHKDPQSALYSNTDKIKSESAETVTIVVHVVEKTKPTTETNVVSEKVTPESVTSETKDNLVKSNDELLSTELSTESANAEKVTSHSTNSEIFPTSTEISNGEKSEKIKTDEPNNLELTTVLPETGELKGEAESRSEEIEPTSDDEVKPESENSEKVLDLKIKEESSETTTQNVKSISETMPAEVAVDDKTTKTEEPKAEEPKTEEPKTEEPKITIKIADPNIEMSPITVPTYSESDAPKNDNEPTKTESENARKSEESKSEEIKSEIREDDSKPEEKIEILITEKVEKTTVAGKVESTTPQTEEVKPEVRESDKEEEKTVTEKNEISRTKNPLIESESEETTESGHQSTEKSTQTEAPKKENE